MKKIIFAFFFVTSNLCFAQGTGSGITFDTVEKDLFPSWKGSGLQNEAKIRPKMTEIELGQLKEFEKIEKTLNEQLKTEKDLLDGKGGFREKLNTANGEAQDLLVKINADSCFTSTTTECSILMNQFSAKNQEYLEAQQEVANSEEIIAFRQKDLRENAARKDAFLAQVWSRLNVHPKGIIGENADQHFLIQYIPLAIDILMKFFAPVVVLILIYTGVRFIYGGDQDEELSKAKQNLMYAFLGFLLVVLSYSLMKAIYFFFAQ